jgi:hypothetical protein
VEKKIQGRQVLQRGAKLVEGGVGGKEEREMGEKK